MKIVALEPYSFYILNKAIETSPFPIMLKCAELTPLYKKDVPLHKKNYRPISVLSCISEVFEGLMKDELVMVLMEFCHITCPILEEDMGVIAY